MGQIVQTTRDLSSSYAGLNIVANRGSFNACGFGVRDRDTETALDTTYFCESYLPVGGGVAIEHFRFRVSTGTSTAGQIVFSFWYRDAGSLTLNYVGEVGFDKPSADWQSNTEYYYNADSPVLLPSIFGRTYYVAVWSQYAKLDASDIGSKRGVTYAGDATASAPIVAASQTDSNYAVSFETWGDPIAWDSIMDGGTIEEMSEDWEDAGGGSYPYCTGTMTDPEKIIGGVTGNAVSGAQNNYIAIDLAAGQTPTSFSLSSDEFPDYTTTGLRAISEIALTMTLASGGIIAVMASDADSASMPSISGPGWSLLGREEYSVGTPVTLTISTPTICRWIAIVELGTSTTDAISLCEIKQIQSAVTDGNFSVSFLNPYHKCWVKNYPTEDAVFKVKAYDANRAFSEYCDPFTNRINRD